MFRSRSRHQLPTSTRSTRARRETAAPDAASVNDQRVPVKTPGARAGNRLRLPAELCSVGGFTTVLHDTKRGQGGSITPKGGQPNCHS